MIRRLDSVFVLHTPNTTYAFKVLSSGHLEHLYYGEKIEIESEKEAEVLVEKRACLSGNAVCYNPEQSTLCLEDIRLEMSSGGKGDVREPFIEVTHADGSYTSDFLFEKAEIKKARIFTSEPFCFEKNFISVLHNIGEVDDLA